MPVVTGEAGGEGGAAGEGVEGLHKGWEVEGGVVSAKGW